MEEQDFFIMPHVIVDSGLWAAMKPSERAVYGVLCHHRNYQTNICFPSIQKICQESGFHKNNVCSALQQLVVYGLIDKKRAPSGLKFRNIFRIKMKPNIDPATFPQKTEKKWKQHRDKKSGKFGVCPQNTETDTFPQNTEAVLPQKTEKNESKMKESLTRDSIKQAPPLTYSTKTLNELKKSKGDVWLKNALRARGYSEVQIRDAFKETEEESQ
jgi:DNA-binding transcriptional MocR family regulator